MSVGTSDHALNEIPIFTPVFLKRAISAFPSLSALHRGAGFLIADSLNMCCQRRVQLVVVFNRFRPWLTLRLSTRTLPTPIGVWPWPSARGRFKPRLPRV
jgi:hypothetical protein